MKIGTSVRRFDHESTHPPTHNTIKVMWTLEKAKMPNNNISNNIMTPIKPSLLLKIIYDRPHPDQGRNSAKKE